MTTDLIMMMSWPPFGHNRIRSGNVVKFVCLLSEAFQAEENEADGDSILCHHHHNSRRHKNILTSWFFTPIIFEHKNILKNLSCSCLLIWLGWQTRKRGSLNPRLLLRQRRRRLHNQIKICLPDLSMGMKTWFDVHKQRRRKKTREQLESFTPFLCVVGKVKKSNSDHVFWRRIHMERNAKISKQHNAFETVWCGNSGGSILHPSLNSGTKTIAKSSKFQKRFLYHVRN